MTVVVLTLALLAIGVLVGWLVPLIVGSRRPYGVWGDIGVSAAIMVGFGLLAWFIILPLFDFSDVVNMLAVFGDPLCLALIVLWLMRKMNPEEPAESLDETE